jgi:phenylpropionate dioxygenase-like ring-hydroxylating dioxygenase large terminal subunit
MFEGFARVWTPVALSAEVKGKPRGVTLAGERVVLFRSAQGVHALLDRCPHRGVALSLGKVTRDGCLECPFHGWQFEGSGACAHVPMNEVSPEKREHLHATALPTRERGGLIWVFTDPGTAPGSEPVMPALLEALEIVTWRYAATWDCHWTRAMENMLDAPHLPFVHRRTIGFQLRRRMTERSRMEVTTERTATGTRIRWSMDQEPSLAWLEFTPPNGMTLGLSPPGKTMHLHIWCVPIDAGHTRMLIANARNFGHYNPFLRLFDEVSRIIVSEDKAVVESSFPSEVPPPAQEKSVATDRGTLAFRKYYFEVLRPSSTAGGSARTG